MKRDNTGCCVSLRDKLIASELAEDVETLNIINLVCRTVLVAVPE